MNLELDFRSGIPIYLQVVERIKEMINDERIRPGDQLPTVRALAAELRVNFNTVARAYRILDEAEVISTQQGRGTYILQAPNPAISQAERQQAFEALTDRYIADALRLGILPEDIHARLRQKINPNEKGEE
jgi:GntR family transcriptional regulator